MVQIEPWIELELLPASVILDWDTLAIAALLGSLDLRRKMKKLLEQCPSYNLDLCNIFKGSNTLAKVVKTVQ